VLAHLSNLRTALADWQVYFEPRISRLSTSASAIDPTDLAKGAQLDELVIANGNDTVAALDNLDVVTNVHEVKAANAALLAAVEALAPLSEGRPAAVISATIATERAAYTRAWNATAAATIQVRTASANDVQRSADHLTVGRNTALAADALAAVVTLAAAIAVGRRARRREWAERTANRRRAFESTMQHALEMAKAEPDVYRVLGEALQTSVPHLEVEMLVADSGRAHFHQTLTTAPMPGGATQPRSGCAVVSPLDCPATRRGHTLSFPTSSALDACPHLKGRPSGACSAVCVAVSLAGKTVGVLHATGPDGVAAADGDVRYLEITSRRAAERIAMLRAFERSEAQARSDPLTGLLNRRSLENRVHDLHREGIPYTLAYGDLDHFKALNDEQGHEAGDQALRLFSRVLRDSIRPNDLAARYGGEEFVIVLPDCSIETATAVLDRLRERLALTLTTGRIGAFTVSFGLASSTDSAMFDDVVAAADRALLAAKTAGRDRIVLASAVEPAGRSLQQM
jgi:diguanylate cyclase (GGDEF)-like protein